MTEKTKGKVRIWQRISGPTFARRSATCSTPFRFPHSSIRIFEHDTEL